MELLTGVLITFLKKNGKVWGIVGNNTYICTFIYGARLERPEISAKKLEERYDKQIHR